MTVRATAMAFSSMFLSSSFSPAIANHNSPESLEARVAAVGTLNIDGTDTNEGDLATDGSDSAVPEDGEMVYNTTCAICHASGVAGAPMLGKTDDWKERIEQGIDTLVEHAIQGFTGSSGVMPPKGGNTSISNEAVTAAVQFMVDQVE